MSKEWYIGELKNSLKRAEKMGKYGLHNLPPAILSCAITGGMQGKSANPNLPESIDEQVQQTYDAYNAGAVIVHIHTRDPKDLSQMSYDPETYKEVNRRVREKCPDIIINNTFVGCRPYFNAGAPGPIQQASAPARPEVGSLDVTRFVYDNMAFCMTMDDAKENIKLFDEYDIKPELECFDPGDFKFIHKLIQRDMVKAPYWIQCIYCGDYNWNGAPGALEYVQLAEKFLPEESLLSLIGIGPLQNTMAAIGLIMGHHVRVGMEDNVYYGKGELAASNAQLVERMVRIAADLGRPLATTAQAREMLGLGEPRQYA